MKPGPTIIVGKIALRSNFAGDMAIEKYLDRMLCPAGLGAFAITVNPPPVTAPASTAFCRATFVTKIGTRDAK